MLIARRVTGMWGIKKAGNCRHLAAKAGLVPLEHFLKFIGVDDGDF